MNLDHIPTIRFPSDLRGVRASLEMRRARHVWRDANGKLLLVVFMRHPEALLYIHKQVILMYPSLDKVAIPRYADFLRQEHGYQSVQSVLMLGKIEHFEKLATTKHWKLDGRNTPRAQKQEVAAAGRKEET